MFSRQRFFYNWLVIASPEIPEVFSVTKTAYLVAISGEENRIVATPLSRTILETLPPQLSVSILRRFLSLFLSGCDGKL